MIAVGEPVETGLVASLARPGENATGVSSLSYGLEGKRLELLREVLPSICVLECGNPIQVIQERETRAAAEVLGMKMLSLGVRSLEEIEEAFAAIVRERPGALLVLADRLFLHHRKRIMDFAIEQRLPGVHAYRELLRLAA